MGAEEPKASGLLDLEASTDSKVVDASALVTVARGSSSKSSVESRRGSSKPSALEAPASRTRTHVDMGSKIRVFHSQRIADKDKLFGRVARLFVSVNTCAVILHLFCRCGEAAGWLDVHIAAGVDAFWYVMVICCFLIATGYPLDPLDLEKMMKWLPKTLTGGCLVGAAIAATHASDFPHTSIVISLLHVGAAACPWKRLRPTWWPSITVFFGLYLILDPISWGCIVLGRRSLKERPFADTCNGLFNVLTGLLSSGLWFRRQWEVRRGIRGSNGTCRATFEALYRFCIAQGVRFALNGLSWAVYPGPVAAHDRTGGLIDLARGVATLVPVAAAMFTGPDRLGRILWYRLDASSTWRRRYDGAFVAELLESLHAGVGEYWWVHRESAQDRYPAVDPRRHWQQGVIAKVELDKGEITVELFPHDDQLLPLGRGPMVPVKLPQGGATKEELLQRAQDGLRCVEFQNLNEGLLRRADASGNPALQAEWYARSRPVRDGERVDFFLSHSWYDDHKLKWKKIMEVAERFRRCHNRSPTFWVDKFCIAQDQIRDGLRCLPINVMACNKLLVVCGQTYLSRLWCIFELFVLFAFSSEASALDSLEFEFLGGHEEGLRLLEELEGFHVRGAHCYDPNEEARLLKIIDAVGVEAFNKRIANIAHVTRASLVSRMPARQQQSGSAHPMGWLLRSMVAPATNTAAPREQALLAYT